MHVRYRKHSLKTLLGLTTAQQKFKRDTELYKITKVINAQANTKRRAKRAAGYESESAKALRFLFRLFK
jgi:hypothetical protein